jgi:thiamine kinase-like enzyme
VKILNILTRFFRARASALPARASGARNPQQAHGPQLPVSPAPRAQERSARDRAAPASGMPFLAADPSLPQLEVAGDPELMRDVFQRHLRPLGEKVYQVRECRIGRVRHQQAKRCILQYNLRLEEPDTGCERSQLVSGVIYAGAPPESILEMLRQPDPEPDSERGNADAFPLFAPFSYISDLEMLVQVFPYDHMLPALPLIMEGPSPELEPLLLARFGPGEWQTETWDIETIRYHTEVRATLRLTMRAQDAASGRAEERRFYAKVYRNEKEGEQTYQVIQALWEKASAEGGGGGFTVGRPIAYLSGLQTLLQEEFPGTSLKGIILRRQGSEVTSAVRKAARSLATLHLDHVPVARRRFLIDEAAELEKREKLLQQACPHLRQEIKEIVGAVISGVGEVPLVPTHCDLNLEHILLDGDRLALVDLDMFAEADPIQDVVRILAHLAFMSLHGRLPRERAWTLAQTFAEEYFAHVPEAWRTHLPIYYAGAILDKAALTTRGGAPDSWSDKVEVLVKEAKDSLAGRVW